MNSESHFFPDTWTNVTSTQLGRYINKLFPESNFVDWRAFLTQLTGPWPVPTHDDLIDMLHKFKELDVKNTGRVNLEQFSQVEMWFPIDDDVPSDQYNRPQKLKDALFTLFEQKGRVNYTRFVSCAQDRSNHCLTPVLFLPQSFCISVSTRHLSKAFTRRCR